MTSKEATIAQPSTTEKEEQTKFDIRPPRRPIPCAEEIITMRSRKDEIAA